jgi:hypothetical protein
VKHLIVCEALIQAKEQIQTIKDFFKEQDWATDVEYVTEWKTLAGQDGEGGRNDTLLEITCDNNQIGKISVQRFGMGSNSPRWLGDYVHNNKEIIPPNTLENLYKQYAGRDYLESPKVDKPKCKLVGTDGNVFALGGRVMSALRKAGQADKATEFSKKLFQCGSYDEALVLMQEYVEVY